MLATLNACVLPEVSVAVNWALIWWTGPGAT
jgi:hypothetical protein